MNGGDGPNSYTNNSTVQGEAVDRAKVLLSTNIQEKLTIGEGNSKVFTIADLGCSVGPNTFTSVTTLIEAVKNTFRTTLGNDRIPEFHVFFNDIMANDFNALFNLMHTSSSLHWLAKVPEQVTKRDSPTWNKGRVTYVQSSPEVVQAYTALFLEGTKAFFTARSVEMAKGGLLAITMPCRPDGSESMSLLKMEYCLGQALADMVKEGIVSEALADAFNIPMYMPNALEIKQVVSSIESLSIEKMEEIVFSRNVMSPDDVSRHVRAVLEGILREHFETELDMDDLFERYAQKFSELPHKISMANVEFLFVLVKRNDVNKE